MTTNTNNNCWSNWSNNINTAYTDVGQINQELKNLQSGNLTDTDYNNDLMQIQNALNSISTLPASAALSQFLTGAQAAFLQISQTMTIQNPGGGQTSVNVAGDGQTISFTIGWDGGMDTAAWMPQQWQQGTGSSSNTNWDSFLMGFQPGDSGTFSYTLPNGDPVTMNVTRNSDGSFSLSVPSAYTASFANYLNVNANTSALSQFMSNYQ